jgi:tetrapyrrole methylase family protein/MazG family protein
MQPIVTVCGLGPGAVDLVTNQTRTALEAADPAASFVRTRRHPSATLAAHARAFDDVYDTSEDLDSVYRTIADTVAAAAVDRGAALYAVPGSPLVLERAVRYLRARDDIEVQLLPAISFLDVAWAALGVDPVEAGVRLVDGHTFATSAAGHGGPMLVAHAHAPWVLSDIKLAIDAGDEQRVMVMQRLGTDDAAVFEIGWPDLDRSFEPDHLTSLYLPDIAEPAAASMQRSAELTHRLRQDCPWDAEQTHGSLRRYLLEEAYEVMEAIDKVERGDPDGYEHLEEELGDLWFQILFHAELAAEAGEFTIADVAETSRQKLVRRHPHVFGDVEVADAEAVASNWEAIKKAEKGRVSVMEGIPDALPALAYAEKVLKKASKAGAAVVTDRSFSDGDEAAAAVLAIVAAGRANDLDLEGSLRTATDRARRRFEALERAALSSSRPIDPTENWLFG